MFTKSVCPGSFRHGDVYVRTWHAMCIAVTEQAGTITRLPSLLLTRSPGFPFPPLALVPNRDPGCHPGRGLTPFPHRQFSGVRDRTAPATVHGVERDSQRDEAGRCSAGTSPSTVGNLPDGNLVTKEVQERRALTRGTTSTSSRSRARRRGRRWIRIPCRITSICASYEDCLGPDGDLYVANAYKDASQVLRFAGKPGSTACTPSGRSTQSSTRPIRVWLIPSRSPLGRTRISTFPVKTRTSSVGTTVHKRPRGTRGLRCRIRRRSRMWTRSIFCPARSSPRKSMLPRSARRAGRIFGPDGDLYVADRDADSVKRYDGGSGEFLREYRHPHLTTPVHLAFRAHDGSLWLVAVMNMRSLPSIPKLGR